MTMAKPFLYIHPILTSVVALVYAAVGLLEIGGPPEDLGEGRTIQRWFLVAIFAAGTVSLTLAARSSWLLLRAEEDQQIVDGPLRLAKMSLRWTFGMLVVGPAIALIEISFTGAWYGLILAFFSGAFMFFPCGLLLRWQLRRIRVRRFG